MTRFDIFRMAPRALCASAIALSLVVPLTGCGGGLGRPFGGGGSTVSRKQGTIKVSVAWPAVSRLIPDASNSIRVFITDSANRDAPGFEGGKVLVRPTDFSGSSPSTVASTTATNLEVGVPGAPENYTITARAFPSTNGTGTAQSFGQTVVALDTENPDRNDVRFTLESEIRSVEINDPDLGRNLGKDRTQSLTAVAKNAAGDVVMTTPAKWKWEIVASGIGKFRNPDGTDVVGSYLGNGATYVAGDPGASSVEVTIQVTETEASSSDPANPTRYTTTTKVTIVPLGLADSDWPRFHGTKQNVGVGKSGTGVLASSATETWRASLGTNVVFSSPTVDKNGVIYICSYNEATSAGGRLTALNPDKTVRWTYNDEGAIGRIESSPVISRDGTVYFGSYSAGGAGKIYAINSTTGRPAWTPKSTAGPVFGTPALDSGGFLYVGTGGTDRKLYKFDSLNGNLISAFQWPAVSNTEFQTSPALSDDEATLYIISSGETLSNGDRVGAKLYAVNTTSGALRWTFDTSDKFVTASSPVVSGGRVFFGTIDGFLYAVNANTGLEDWSQPFDAQAQIYSTVAVSPDGATLYFATFDNISGLDENRIFALETATGNPVWTSVNFAQGFTSSPALSNDGSRLYIGNYDGRVYGVSTGTGAVAWAFNSGAGGLGFDSSPAITAGNTLYIGGFEGNLYKLNP